MTLNVAQPKGKPEDVLEDKAKQNAEGKSRQPNRAEPKDKPKDERSSTEASGPAIVHPTGSAVRDDGYRGIWYWLLMAVPGLWFLAEMLTMLTNKRRRALHDCIAGTVVIETHAEFVLGKAHLYTGLRDVR